ncbi:hypothetical protein EDB84DRAFT_1680245 [Lactarius hengduanensis]|nr:hypothetical protein EDB84DRAFT_1680245 [Lactarius hengduanensis]
MTARLNGATTTIAAGWRRRANDDRDSHDGYDGGDGNGNGCGGDDDGAVAGKDVGWQRRAGISRAVMADRDGGDADGDGDNGDTDGDNAGADGDDTDVDGNGGGAGGGDADADGDGVPVDADADGDGAGAGAGADAGADGGDLWAFLSKRLAVIEFHTRKPKDDDKGASARKFDTVNMLENRVRGLAATSRRTERTEVETRDTREKVGHVEERVRRRKT